MAWNAIAFFNYSYNINMTTIPLVIITVKLYLFYFLVDLSHVYSNICFILLIIII